MALNGPDLTAADNIVRAAKASCYERVFFLGPYARRVSFASQQNRALNLIWALTAFGTIRKGDKVAIVGGGLAGVTAFVALKDLGYKVYLYERGEAPLTRQSSARHRYIHPSINRWPENTLTATTVLPYFDWTADICTNLLSQLKDEWIERLGETPKTFEPDVVVTAFHEAPDKSEVAVSTEQTSKFAGERYKAVIVTSGFSDERVPNGCDLKTYWDPDTLATEVGGNKVNKVFVSGCGDGGLIDALRIAHKRFAEGQLTIEVAQWLDRVSWPLRQEIQDAERRVARTQASLEDAIRNGSEDLQVVYFKAAAALPKKLRDYLEKKSLRKNRQFLVTIYAREKYPFTPMSAPIHKLLLAHALKAMVVRHIQCEVIDYDCDKLVYVDPGVDTGDRTKWREVRGRLLVRHGAGPNFSAFFDQDPDAAKDLVARQKLLAENLDLPIWAEVRDPLKVWPPTNELASELRRREKQGEKLVRSLVGVSGHFSRDDQSGFVFEHALDHKTLEKVGALPEKLFGFPLRCYPMGDRPQTPAAPLGAPVVPRTDTGPILHPGYPIFAALNGRLGVFVTNRAGTTLALTVAHVLFTGAEARFNFVVDANQCLVGRAVSKSRAAEALLDDGVAVIEIDPSRPISLRYGSRFDIIDAVIDVKQAVDDEVLLINRSGQLRRGIISATRTPVGYTLRASGGPTHVSIDDAIRIRPHNPEIGFAEPGDSGAPVVDKDGRLLGLVISGDESFTHIVPVKGFLEREKLSLCTTARPAQQRAKNWPPPAVAANVLRFAERNREALSSHHIDLGPPPDDYYDE